MTISRKESKGDTIDQGGSFGVAANKGDINAHNVNGTVNEKVERHHNQAETINNIENYYASAPDTSSGVSAPQAPVGKDSKDGQKNSCQTEKSQVDRLVIKLNGIGFDEFVQDPEIQKALSLLLQKASGDTSVNFEKIEEGSIKITLNGSSEGLERLANLVQSGKLREDFEKLGLSVEDVKRIALEATGEDENSEEGDFLSLQDQIAIAEGETEAAEETRQPPEQLERKGRAVRRHRRTSTHSIPESATVGSNHSINRGGGNYSEHTEGDHTQGIKGGTTKQDGSFGVGESRDINAHNVAGELKENNNSQTQNQSNNVNININTPPQAPDLSPRNSTRRRLLKYAALAGASGVAAVVARALTTPESPQKPPTPESPAPESPTPEASTPELPIPTTTTKFEVVTVSNRGEVVDRVSAEARIFRENLGSGVSLDLVSIPGGTFWMGAPSGEKGSTKDERNDDHLQHQVAVKSFSMGKYPVTQAQWRAVASLPKIERDLNPAPSKFTGDNLPVEKVSWYEAEEFCARLSKKTGRKYRLPSEAEWEYACRAGTTTPFHFGETITTELANYRGTDDEERGWKGSYGNGPLGEYRGETTPVDKFGVANAFGLCDMHGNVWEWCADYGHKDYRGAPTDGTVWTIGGSDKYRILRGGSYLKPPELCRSAERLQYDIYKEKNYTTDLGFRVVVEN